MLTYKDCLDWSELDQGEVDAIAEHEHLDRILALSYGIQISKDAEGYRHMRRILIDDIRHAEQHDNLRHAEELKKILDHYIKAHPL
jgi:hypothetical protein